MFTPAADPSLSPGPDAHDLGPLAWVLDELRKSLDTATKSLRRFVRETHGHGTSDIDALDPTPLRLARQQLHQAAGALTMVGQPVPARMLGAMESTVQQWVQSPLQCTEAAATAIEQASFALVEYLEGVLAGRPVSPVGLFPQYRDVLTLAGADRVHPADLFTTPWDWADASAQLPATAPVAYSPEVRAQLDQSVLRLVRADPQAARQLRDLALGFAAAQHRPEPRSFWQLAAGMAEAVALGLLPMDVYAKRAATRLLLQYATLVQGDDSVSDRLAQDLLFFCAQSQPAAGVDAPVLQAVRAAHHVADTAPVNYAAPVFGRFDPTLLTQARKRIAAAKEAWSHLSGGDVAKLRPVADQFGLVADSLVRLHPPSASLAQTLTSAMETILRSGQPPSTELAMEVATSVLYLEATFEDLAPHTGELAERTARLAERLQGVLAGGASQPLEPWMEELYRRVSDRHTMGSVVGELRTAMSELEGALDQFFRNPHEKGGLARVPAQLTQMRGVLSVLGLDHAGQAVLRMRDMVDDMLATEVDVGQASARFDQLGNNLGALGFLIDMLNYQPALARKLFVFDDASGELKLLMGRAAPAQVSPSPAPAEAPAALARVALATAAQADAPATTLTEQLGSLAAQARLAEQPALAAAALAAAQAVSDQGTEASAAALQELAAVAATPPAAPAQPVDDGVEEDDLRDIFLEEAREVLAQGQAAVATLRDAPQDLDQLTTLRRSFHTLKGSSRMVGLGEFGTAAWHLEQLLNTWLADQLAATPALLAVAGESLNAFGHWVDAIAAGQDSSWQAEPFRLSADALRLQGQQQPLLDATPAGQASAEAVPATVAAPGAVPDDLQFDLGEPVLATAPPPHLPLSPPASSDHASDDFDLDFDDAAAAIPAPATAAEPTTLSEPDFAALFGDLDLSLPTPAEAPLVIADIDLAGLAAVAAQAPPPEPSAEATPEALPEPTVAPVAEPVTEAMAEPQPEPAAALADTASDDLDELPLRQDEQTKVIDGLRISLPLYNVYLNEADEWSRHLLTALGEWALELHRPIPADAVAMAHSLAGSSATVGFAALSGLAKTLEQALQHAQPGGPGNAAQAQTYVAAAEDIRRLLHQFAAGFLKEPNPAVQAALRALAEAVPPPAEVPAMAVPVAEAPAAEPLPATARAETEARAAVLDADDELDATDAVDIDLFPIFEEEAIELLPQLSAALRQWTARPDNGSARTEVLRVLHTLKGSARLAGALRLGELAHLLESEIESLGSAPEAEALPPLLGRFDALQATFEQLRAQDAQRYQALSTGEPLPQAASPEPDATAAPSLGPVAPLGVELPAGAAASARQAASHTVRVRAQLLERLLNQAGEIMLTRTRMAAEMGQLRGALKELSGNLDRLRSQLRDVELQAETQMESRLAQTKEAQQEFDPLEFDRYTRVQELTRMMAESVNDVGTVQRNLQRTVEVSEDELAAQARQTRELQRDLLRTRMLEFEGISERLYRVVRQTSKETGKQVALDIVGGSIEMDRAVLDRMTPAFEHLLRNAVVHGIESPEQRLAQDKPATGQITVRLRQEGNDVSVEFEDDGAGIDLPAVRRRAEALGLAQPDQLGQDDAALLIFQPGFSTAHEVTELAGRGIGMDVVRAEVNALGGRIETHSQTGQGTRFRLVLPLTTAVTQVVMLRMGALALGVPAGLIELVRRTNAEELAAAYASGQIGFGGEQVPFFWGGALLQSSPHSTETGNKTIPVVVVRSAGQRVALHVDEVLGNQEVVVKNLGVQLARLPGLSGMTVLASGAVALIYNPVALATVYGEQARQWMASAGSQTPAVGEAAGVAQAPLVLVVDDSITVRRVTQRLLQREGYRVALAADGLQALRALQEERPVMVLSDIEMPRMDGFDLLRAIRNDATLTGLPVVMITSRMAQKHRDHARDLGADHYLGKPYAEDELLRLVKRYSSVEKIG